MTEIINGSPSMNSQALQTALELSMLNISASNLDGLDSSCNFFDQEARSSNITQCVAVPSSEHVAEIVGRQGCKIKALRAKTNTYIKTPVRGEDPVFAISGRPELVNSAKWEIIAAAEHFSQIRAARSSCSPNSFGSSENKVTIHVRVPYRVVGLVVGPKGATVKRIQQLTQTHIVTPSRDKEPCFEVKGSPESVQLARKEIESYIALRTGNNMEEDSTFYGDSPFSPINDPFSPNQPSTQMLAQQMHQCQLSDPPSFQFPGGHISSSTNLSSGTQREPFALGGHDGTSRNQWKPPLPPTVFSGLRFTPPNNTYQSAPLLMPGKVFDFNSTSNRPPQPLSPTGSYESNSSDGLAATSPKQFSRLLKRGLKSSCIVCKADSVALLPCGHSMLCPSCVACSHGHCPVCNQVTNIVRM